MTAAIEARPATRPAAKSSALSRPLVVALAVLMPLGPAFVAVLRGVLPDFSSSTGRAAAAAAAHASGRQSLVVWMGYLATLTLVPGVIAAGGLARRGAPRLAAWAVALLVPAYLSLGGIMTSDSVLWSAHHVGLSAQAAGALYDHQHPALNVAAGVFVVGHVSGTVLLGIALLRARVVPALAGWALAISQPLHLIAFVILNVQPLDAAAWTLTAVGMAFAGWASVHSTAELSSPATA